MKIIYNDSHDAKIASVILYQKFVMNFGLDMKEENFFVINDNISSIPYQKGEYVIIIGIPLTQDLYNEIEKLIRLEHCKVLYICNEYSDIIDDLYSLSDLQDDDGLSLKIVYDTSDSLSLLAWIASRYRLDENISKILIDSPYNLTERYEYLIFCNDENNKISIPWLVRFITDLVCFDNTCIPETSDFQYGIETMMDLSSNHVSWERLLTDDKEVMQLMTSGIPIRQYVERMNLKIKKTDETELNNIKLNSIQRFVKKLFKI